MAEFALWKSMKHYLQGAAPAAEHQSESYLEGFARARDWAKPAIIAERGADGRWWPKLNVYKHTVKPHPPGQPKKYVEYRESSDGKTLPKHLGEPLTDLTQA